jgi:predicted ATPase
VSQDIVMTAGEFAVLALEDVRRDPPVLVSSRGVGYGVGQLLPIIVQSLLTASGMILVEQPEVHLHPRLQSAVGDLFVDTVVSGRAQVLVETHSEHLVLRLLRRVREGVLAPADLAILYVDLDEDGAAFVRRLEVDSDGDLADGWPGGFFDERLAEVLGGRS